MFTPPVIFDVPKENKEVIRRAGRTGRRGEGGHVTVLCGGYEAGRIKGIMNGVKKGALLDDEEEGDF